MHLIFAYTFTSQLHILLCIPSFYCEGLAHICECLFVRLVLYPLLLIFCCFMLFYGWAADCACESGIYFVVCVVFFFRRGCRCFESLQVNVVFFFFFPLERLGICCFPVLLSVYACVHACVCHCYCSRTKYEMENDHFKWLFQEI